MRSACKVRFLPNAAISHFVVIYVILFADNPRQNQGKVVQKAFCVALGAESTGL